MSNQELKMYKDNESLLSDLNVIKSCLYDLLEGHFDEPIGIINRSLNLSGESGFIDLIGGDGTVARENTTSRFYMLYGRACLLVNNAVLTFSLGDIDSAKNALNDAKNSAYNSTAGWWTNRQTNIENYSLIQLHAQLVQAECEFLLGVLAILKAVVLLHKTRDEVNNQISTEDRKMTSSQQNDHSFEVIPEDCGNEVVPTVAHFYGAECLFCVGEPGGVSFKKSVSILYNHFTRLALAGLNFMKAHSMFLHLAEILKSSSSKDLSNSSQCEVDLLNELNCGVKIILGSIQLFSAVLPQRALGLLQIVRSLQPDKVAGMKLLQEAQQIPAMRQILPSTCLLTYQLVFLQHIGPSNETNTQVCSDSLSVMAKLLSNNSFLVQYFSGLHHMVVENDFTKAQDSFSLVDNLDHTVFLQVKLIARFELLWIHASKLDWAQASLHAKVLAQQTYWTRAHFHYLHALFEVCTACDKFTTKRDIRNAQPKIIQDLNLSSRLKDLEKLFACHSQIKVVAVDRLAVLRSQQLLQNIELCYLFALEAIFWNNQFRHLAPEDSHSDLLAKTKSLIHGKLECLEIVEKAVFRSNLDHADEVAVFVVFALEVCSTERSRKPELLKMCFDIVKMLLHSQKELDSDCVLGPLLFFLFLKVCCDYLKSADFNLDSKKELNEISDFVIHYLFFESSSDKEESNNICRVVRLKQCCETFSSAMKKAKDSASFSDSNSIVSGRAHFLFRSLRYDFQKVLNALS